MKNFVDFSVGSGETCPGCGDDIVVGPAALDDTAELSVSCPCGTAFALA